MNRTIRIFIVLVILLSAGLIVVEGMGIRDESSQPNRQQEQRVNLALRETADRLLDLAGDSTAYIPPVTQVNQHEFLLCLEQTFNYDSLPAFLEESFERFELPEDYYVMVNDCMSQKLVLGYQTGLFSGGEIACSGRDQKAACYNLSVVFNSEDLEEPLQKLNIGLWVSLLAFSLLALAFSYYKQNKQPESLAEPAVLVQPAVEPALLAFGDSVFDPKNLYVIVQRERHSLTFREAKLLEHFVRHANQLLERPAILAAVWEDEGVIVGRSLDVFVSRLRKILKKDESVKIANVHGVGYRLVVE